MKNKIYQFYNKFGIEHFNRHIIHFYPSVALKPMSTTKNYMYDNGTKIIATQSFTYEYIMKQLPHKDKKDTMEIYGVPLMRKNQTFQSRKLIHSPQSLSRTLNVCFTSLGDPKSKGVPQYIHFVQYFKKHYPTDNVTFYSIGVHSLSSEIIHMKPMPQESLTEFYTKQIDIICNFETTKYLNGWPLGMEVSVCEAQY